MTPRQFIIEAIAIPAMAAICIASAYALVIMFGGPQ
jgi:hypothetical protein